MAHLNQLPRSHTLRHPNLACRRTSCLPSTTCTAATSCCGSACGPRASGARAGRELATQKACCSAADAAPPLLLLMLLCLLRCWLLCLVLLLLLCLCCAAAAAPLLCCCRRWVSQVASLPTLCPPQLCAAAGQRAAGPLAVLCGAAPLLPRLHLDAVSSVHSRAGGRVGPESGWVEGCGVGKHGVAARLCPCPDSACRQSRLPKRHAPGIVQPPFLPHRQRRRTSPGPPTAPLLTLPPPLCSSSSSTPSSSTARCTLRSS